MNTFAMRLTICALAACLAPAALAQQGDWYVAPSIVYNDDDPDRKIDDGVSGIQVTVGRDFGDHISLEGLLGYSDIDGFYLVSPGTYVRGSETQLALGANVLAYYDRDARFAPYLLAGVGHLSVDPSVGSTESNPTASIGAGFKLRMGESRFALLGEVRLRRTFDGGGREFDDGIATLGVQYRFGARARVSDAPPTDSDGDGVLDMWDECPNTPAGVAVTSRGCEIMDMNRDADGDRIPDGLDECPNTPPGIPVDPSGCALDSDRDGVTSDRDRCPASRPGAIVNEYGCENDSDKDGVLDHQDKCPNTRPGVRTDVDGCEIKDVINLPGVNFESNSDTLLPGTEYLLQTVADTLNKHPDLLVEVAGHSDNVGNADWNIGLSMRRAKTVRNYLIHYGVNENRLTFKGYGEAQPIADNSTAEGRATNRRVELRIVNR
jgi:OOP family OmpA-OmpF porin